MDAISKKEDFEVIFWVDYYLNTQIGTHCWVIIIYSLENCYHFGPLLTKILISLSIRENIPIMMDICSFNTPDAYNETRYVYRIICECLKRIYLPDLLCPPHITMWEYIRALRKLYWFTHMDHPIGIWG